jgi:hypothetical protein
MLPKVKDKCNIIAIKLENNRQLPGYFPSNHEFFKQYYRSFFI